MMNPEIKKQWVAALRSGEYRKGTGQLRDSDDRYCCLGVLCELGVKAGVTQRENPSGYYDSLAGRLDNGVLTESVQIWAGLDSNSPDVFADDEWVGLADLNDNYGSSFATIADYIEKSSL